jgi:hypothetical protein
VGAAGTAGSITAASTVRWSSERSEKVGIRAIPPGRRRWRGGSRRALDAGERRGGGVLTAFGVVVLTFMMLMYALERRGPRFVLAFAVGCALSSVYGFLAGTWPFGIVELIWSGIAVRRYVQLRREPHDPQTREQAEELQS